MRHEMAEAGPVISDVRSTGIQWSSLPKVLPLVPLATFFGVEVWGGIGVVIASVVAVPVIAGFFMVLAAVDKKLHRRADVTRGVSFSAPATFNRIPGRIELIGQDLTWTPTKRHLTVEPLTIPLRRVRKIVLKKAGIVVPQRSR